MITRNNTSDVIKNIIEKQILNGGLKLGDKINQFAFA